MNCIQIYIKITRFNYFSDCFSKKNKTVDESEMDEGEKEILGQTPLPRDGRVPDAKYRFFYKNDWNLHDVDDF